MLSARLKTQTDFGQDRALPWNPMGELKLLPEGPLLVGGGVSCPTAHLDTLGLAAPCLLTFDCLLPPQNGIVCLLQSRIVYFL